MPRHRDTEREQIQTETRRLLLQAATEEFAREGYAGANINRIARAAGFAKGTIYNYFESKQALMLAIIDATAKAHFDFVAGAVLQEGEPARRLERFFEAGFAFVSQHVAPALVMVNTLFGPEAVFKKQMYRAYQPMFELVGRDIVAAGVAQQRFRPVDPAATATLLMTLYLGSGSQIDAQGQPWLDPGEVAAFALHALQQGQLHTSGAAGPNTGDHERPGFEGAQQ